MDINKTNQAKINHNKSINDINLIDYAIKKIYSMID